ncbi:cytotoxic and regulatory T-cell molecule [Varanus komodoensis]|uniref:cytotoxic and regulatory T-cell molecule n=1 Tax=Varanus komodoensis TaxID=61221 RepID=UPI001CF77C4B|nr:cytotoxic and regulatory T-cell molecule [Varanus komodoensis]
MVSASLLCLLVLLPLHGAFEEYQAEHQTVLEGQNLDLHCAFAGDGQSALEWKNPSGFVLFFNSWQGLKNQRYKLIHSSENSLSIRLSNIKKHENGVYTCLYYSLPVKRKLVNVTVLDAPIKSHLEASKISVPNENEKVVLKCSVWAPKPRPRITWLLDNGMEILGDAKHQQKGKNCNSTSTLIVYRYLPNSTISCVIRHKALGRRNVMTTLHFKNIKLAAESFSNPLGFSTTTTEKPHHYTGLKKTLNTTEASFSTQAPFSRSGEATLNSVVTRDLARTLNRTEENSSLPTPFPTSGRATLNSSTIHGSGKILNVSEGDLTTQTPFLSTDITLDSQIKNGTNLTHDGIFLRKPNILLPALVTVLLVVLIIFVILFIAKLWKAHRKWKKENEVSEQTLESNRPRPNEDNHKQKKNRNVVPWKTSKRYIIQDSCMRKSKNSEESQDSSVFEKQFPYVKRSDL